MQTIALLLILFAPSSLLAESFYADGFYVDMAAPGLSTGGGEITGPLPMTSGHRFSSTDGPALRAPGPSPTHGNATGQTLVDGTLEVDGVLYADSDLVVSNLIKTDTGNIELAPASFVLIVPFLLAFEGTTSGQPAWKKSGNSLRARLADDSDDTVVRASQLISTTGPIDSATDVRAGGSGKFHWPIKSEIYSTADKKINFTDDATTDFDQVTFGPETANYPAFYPDSAGGVTLAAGDAISTAMALDVVGNLTAAKMNSDTHVFAGADYRVGFANRTLLESRESGDLTLVDYALTGFDALKIGPAMGTDASPSDVSVLGPNAWA